MSTNGNSKPVSKPPPVRARLVNLLKNLALFGTVLLVCLALAEGTLRLMGYGNVEIYEADPLVYWRLKPNQDCFTKIDRKPVHINSHGTRGREFSVPKPAGTFRILSLGDSKTFGWGLSEAENYSAVMEKNLRAKFPGRNIEVINAGVNAWSYPQMNVFFRERALAWQPDMVVLADANLWTQFSEKNDPAFVRSFLKRVRLKNFLRRFALYHYVVEVKLKEFYEVHRTKFVPVDPKKDESFKAQQQSDPEAVFRDAIGGLCATAMSNNIRPVLLYMPMLDTLIGTNNPFAGVERAKGEVSRFLNVPLLDMTAELRPRAKDLYLDADPVHLNAAGNEIVGNRLSEFISPLLKP